MGNKENEDKAVLSDGGYSHTRLTPNPKWEEMSLLVNGASLKCAEHTEDGIKAMWRMK